jgi:hypothetical protein
MAALPSERDDSGSVDVRRGPGPLELEAAAVPRSERGVRGKTSPPREPPSCARSEPRSSAR